MNAMQRGFHVRKIAQSWISCGKTRENSICQAAESAFFGCAGFADVLQAHLKDLTHMVVRQSIIDVFSVAAVDDEVCVPQCAELMRNRGLGHIQKRRKVANAQFVLVQRPHDLGARAVAEHLEKVREVV